MSTTQKTVVVTGAARGIGEGIALRLGQDGHHVVVADLPSMESDLQGTADAITAAGGTATAIVADVTDEASVDALVDGAAAAGGQLDGFVANAGIAQVEALLDYDLQAFKKIVDVNLTGLFLSYRAAAKKMKDQGTGGKIIGAASIVAFRPFAYLGPVRAPQSRLADASACAGM
jgi:meso-butanediol dehydrogenase / (S,S)-butanediol dehydrogenase / diacetyl reductase